jgi:hypothetical protein
MAADAHTGRDYQGDGPHRRGGGPLLLPHPEPPAPEDIAGGVATGAAGALFGPSGVVIALVAVGFAAWLSDRLRALEEEQQDRADVEDARAALAEAEESGTIPLEQLRAELGL